VILLIVYQLTGRN